MPSVALLSSPPMRVTAWVRGIAHETGREGGDAMARKTSVPRSERPVWTTPVAEEIRVSAEATAYMGAWEDQDWV